MNELFAFVLGILTVTPPAMLIFSKFNNRVAFELLGWMGSMCSGIIIYIVFFSSWGQ